MSVQYAYNDVANAATVNPPALFASKEYVWGKSCWRRKDCPGEDLDVYGVALDRDRLAAKFEKTRRRNKKKVRAYIQRALRTSNQRGTAMKRSGDVSQWLTCHRDASCAHQGVSHA